MSEGTAQEVVWALAALLVVLLVATLRLSIGDPTSEGGGLVFGVILAVGLVSFSTIGLLIAAKAPDNPIGWLYAVGGLGIVLGIGTGPNRYAVRALTDMELPGAGYAQFASNAITPEAVLALVMALLLFPTGRLASRRWQVIGWAIADSQETEASVYFCTLEAMTNATKYADASVLTLDLVQADGHLRFTVTDDGRGFDPATTARGTGMQGMVDRLDAIGGTLRIESTPGARTTVAGTVPIGHGEPRPGTAA